MIKSYHNGSATLVLRLVIFTMFLCQTGLWGQNTVGIGTATPNSNAVLELVSPTGNQGVLLPRISTLQRLAMATSLTSTENGLIVFDTDLNLFYHWVNTSWVVGLGSFSNAAGGDLQGTYPDPTLRDDAVNSTKIQDGSIATTDLADNSVTVQKINSEGNTNAVLGTDASGIPQWEPKANFIGTGLTNGTILIGDVVNVAQPQTVSGDVSLANDGTATITDNSVTSSKILDNSIVAADIATDAVAADEIALGAVTTDEILDGSVATVDLADDAVTSSKILDATITAADIGTDAVGTDEIATGAVTTDELLDGGILNADMASDAVNSSTIADGSIITDDIASGGNNKVLITTAGGTVFWENISLFETSTLPEGNIFVGDVTNTAAPLSARGSGRILIGDGTSIQSLNLSGDISLTFTGDAQINSGVVGSTEVTDNSLTLNDIAPNAIEASELADNSVDNGAVQDNAVSTAKIVDNAVNNSKIADDAVTSAKISDGTIVTSDLADDAVSTAKIDGEGNNNAVLTTNGAGNPQWEDRSNFGTSSLPNANVFIGDVAGTAQARPVTGDVTISNTGNVQINSNVIGTNEVTDNSLTLDDIGPNAIESSELADNAVDVGAIQSNAITTPKLIDDAVTVAKIDGAGNNNSILTTDAGGNPQWEAKSTLDIDPTNEIQDLSLTVNTLSLSGDPSTVDLSGYLDNTDAQNLTNVLTQGNNASGLAIANVLDPTNAQDVATKNYVDTQSVDDADADPNNEIQDLSLGGNTLSLTGDATTVDLSGYLDNTDSQDLSLAVNTLSLTNDATTVDLSSYLDNTDSQDLGNVLTQGNNAGGVAITNVLDPTNAQDAATKNYVDTQSVDDADADPNNEIQDLSLAANTLSLTGDATMVDLSGYLDNTDTQNLSNVLTQSNNAGGTAITNVADPTNAQDVATKNYVDNITVTSANIGNNSIGSNNIINGSITSADIGPGEISTSDMANDAINSAKIGDLTIVNADISNSANIAASKLENAVMVSGENVSLLANDAGYLTSVVTADIADNAVTSIKIQDLTIANGDISGTAAIDGSKINPDFGTQNIQTTGTLNSGAATVSSLTVTNLAGSNDTYTGDGAVNSFTISAGGAFSSSDKRLKKNIEPINNALERITDVSGKEYIFKNDPSKELHYGVIAQDIQELFPHLVKQNEQGYLAVNYLELIPVLVEAIKEQQLLITQLMDSLNEEKNVQEQLKVGLQKQQTLLDTQARIMQQLQLDKFSMQTDIQEIKRSLGLEAVKE